MPPACARAEEFLPLARESGNRSTACESHLLNLGQRQDCLRSGAFVWKRLTGTESPFSWIVGERKGGGGLATPARVPQPSASISAAADLRLTEAAAGCWPS